MNGATLVAIAATIGNFLQGWDNATIAGAVVYIKRELELTAAVEGLIVAMSLIGATVITTCSGTISDSVGRRPMLIVSSMFYFLSGIIMLWSPNVYVLLLARLLDGFGIGLAVTLVPLYISETAPSEIRGQLNTLPQFLGSGGMFLAYCMVFSMSLLPSPSWRLMLGVLSIPSLLYFAFTVFYLPESPRWLVSKGRMVEARRVLQKLRGREDVSGEMALLVEGLAVGGEASLEEYIIGPADESSKDQNPTNEEDTIKLYGPEAGHSWIAKPATEQSRTGLISRHGSVANQSVPLMDPLVTLFGSVHEKLPETSGSMRSMLFANFGSMLSTAEANMKHEEWDEESLHRGEDEGYTSEDAGPDEDDNLRSPLMSRQATETGHHESLSEMRRHSSLMHGGEAMGIGGGWQMAVKWSEKDGEGGFKRVYLHQEDPAVSRRGSLISVTGGGGGDGDGGDEYTHTTALVNQQAKEISGATDTSGNVSVLSALLEPGVKRALIVGIGLQILQQFSGINGVLYYTPQILQQAGVGVLLANLGLGADSSSFLVSTLTNFLMLPCITVAMRFMDIAGRRSLLLTTIPVLILSLIALVIGNVFDFGTVAHAVISTVCVIVYFCTFVMGYGPIPNILCSEIFPTRVRGICIAICALVFWICDVIVTYSLPVMLSSIGLAGVFGIYAVVCVISWVFIFLRVPETKGMPLEVITEFFAVGAKQGAKSE
ncbi:hypothetical protein ABFS83_03G006800 [Erythranthe nasuta]